MNKAVEDNILKFYDSKNLMRIYLILEVKWLLQTINSFKFVSV